MRFAEDALARLAELDWPGNVRQLRNLIHRLVIFGERDLITADDVGQHRTSHPSDGVQGMTLAQPVSRLLGEELLRGLSSTAPFRENRVRLAQNQIRSLEEKGHDVDEICKIMGLVRSSFFVSDRGQSNTSLDPESFSHGPHRPVSSRTRRRSLAVAAPSS